MDIYIDMLFLLNFGMGYIIIRSAGSLCGHRVRRWRVFAGAFVSAALYVAGLLIGGDVVSIVTGISGMVGGLATAYVPLGARRFGSLVLAAFTLTVSLGGGAMAAYNILVADGAVPFRIILAASAIMLFIVRNVITKIKDRAMKKAAYTDIRVRLAGAEASVTALVDTGHSLYEPISGKPVVVAEFEALRQLFPTPITSLFSDKRENDPEHAAEAFSQAGYATRFRLVPYQSIGQHNGLLIGFRPDETFVGEDTRDCIIAVYNGKLSAENDYRSLAGSDII